MTLPLRPRIMAPNPPGDFLPSGQTLRGFRPDGDGRAEQVLARTPSIVDDTFLASVDQRLGVELGRHGVRQTNLFTSGTVCGQTFPGTASDRTVWKRHYRFSMGTGDMVLSAWQAEADAKAEIDGRLSVDSTVARVH